MAAEGTKSALPSNDLDALWNIWEWLSDRSINFKLKKDESKLSWREQKEEIDGNSE
jgi:hypothetical protein